MREPEDRFDALYRAHYRAIYSYAYRRLAGRRDEVADTVAEVFAVAWRRLNEAPTGERELLWLYGVAYHCVLRARRSDWRRLRLMARLTEEARNRQALGGAGQQEAEVREAIERLRPLDREVLRLVMWEGLSHSEAGEVLGCSANAIAQRLHTARRRLRVALAEPVAGSTEITSTT